MRARHFLPALALSLSLSLSGASLAHAQQSAQQAFADDVPLPILQSLAYVDIEQGRALNLSEGFYRDERRAVRLLAGMIGNGDLDGDGTRDAAVLLEERGAQGTVLHVAMVVQRAGRVRNMASWRLGENVQVRSLTIEDGTAVLSLLAMGEGDLPAQPTVRMLVGLKLAGSEVQLMRREPKGRLAAAPARYDPANWD